MKIATVFILTLLICVFSISTAMAQLNISGTVTESESGDPLPGANVAVKGTMLGVSTDATGSFNLRLDNLSSATISYIFYRLQNSGSICHFKSE